MTRAIAAAAAAALLPLVVGAQSIRPMFKTGGSFSYKVKAIEINYDGAGSKVTQTFETVTPVQVSVASSSGKSAALTVLIGPVIIKGKSMGRAKTRKVTVDAGNGVQGFGSSPFAVAFPVGGVTPGQKWKSGVSAIAPLPAGLVADYTFAKVVTAVGAKFAQINVSVTSKGAAMTKGSGQLFVRLSDGLLDHGSLVFDLAFLRPDPKNKAKMLVNSHQTFKYSITAR